jgi:hypothetical protein
LYYDKGLKWLAVCIVSAEMLNCKLLSTQAADIKHLYFVAEFLQHKCKRMIKSKFRASNALLNSAEHCITRKEHFSFLA